MSVDTGVHPCFYNLYRFMIQNSKPSPIKIIKSIDQCPLRLHLVPDDFIFIPVPEEGASGFPAAAVGSAHDAAIIVLIHVCLADVFFVFFIIRKVCAFFTNITYLPRLAILLDRVPSPLRPRSSHRISQPFLRLLLRCRGRFGPAECSPADRPAHVPVYSR